MNKYILISAIASSLIYASGPVYKTGQNKVYMDGDDATYKMGLNANFISLDSGNIIKDTRLNLLWQNDHKITNNNGDGDTWEDLSYDDAVNYCKNLEPVNTWRLPTRLEAKTIFTFAGALLPYVQEPFKDTVTWDYRENVDGQTSLQVIRFWVETESITDSTKAWSVDFFNGMDRAPTAKTNTYNVRCVSGSENIKHDYERSNGIVTDKITRLMWQDDYDNNSSSISDTITSDTWENAINYCENLTDLGYDDWRLPNAVELYYLSDDTRISPAIDPIFVYTADKYWTSTTIESNSAYKVIVKFSDGGDSGADRSKSNFIRCVRGGIDDSKNSLPSIINYLLD